MASTTNYSWSTPDDTALVKDGAAAIRSLGSAIDSTVFTNASAAINKTIVDAKGDIIAATAADTVSRLAVGSNDQVLMADSSTATGLKWATAGGGDIAWSLVNTGGTTLSGAATITISGITKDKVFVYIPNAYCLSGSSLRMRFNSDSTSKYASAGPSIRQTATYVGSGYGSTVQSIAVALDGGTYADLGVNSGSNVASVSGYIQVLGAKNTGIKTFTTAFGTSNYSSGSDGYSITTGGIYSGTGAITSISLINSGGNFNGGTAYVYEG